MSIKPIIIISLFLFLGLAFYYPIQMDSSNHAEEQKDMMSSIIASSNDSLTPNKAIASNDPYATKGLDKKPRHDYICEVHFFDSNYEELENLEDFKGDYKTVQRITIQRQGISSLPQNILNFKNVELLDLSHNKFETIAVEKIKNFKNLKKLYLNSNLLTKTEINTIKTQLPNITVFDNEDVNK